MASAEQPGPDDAPSSSGTNQTGTTMPSQLLNSSVRSDCVVPGTTQRRTLFYGEIQDGKSLVPLLRSILVNAMAVVVITNRGWKVVVEQPHAALQATTLIDRSYFKKYRMENESTPVSIYLRLNELICAFCVMFRVMRRRRRRESGYENPLVRIKFENERLKMKQPHSFLFLTTFTAPTIRFYSMAFVNKIIMDASVLVNFWRMADNTSRILELKILDSSPWIELVTKSDRARFAFRINAQSPHVEHYECTLPMAQRYELRLVHFTLRPLLLASKVCLQMDSNGLLLMQFLIRFDSDQQPQIPAPVDPNQFSKSQANQPTDNADPKSFVEFYIVPIID